MRRRLSLIKRKIANVITSKPKSIALVGNGPSSQGFGEEIDSHELVVRISTTPYYGKNGTRIDVLVILNWSDPGYRITTGITPLNEQALNSAGEIWLPMAPEEMMVAKADQESPPPWPSYADFSKDVISNFVRGRTCIRFPPSIWRDLTKQLRLNGAEISHSASTGAVVLAYLRRAYPISNVFLYGFSHEGWPGHPWDAEAKWMQSLPKVTIRK